MMDNTPNNLSEVLTKKNNKIKGRKKRIKSIPVIKGIVKDLSGITFTFD